MQIWFLGTGAGRPNKQRNVSSIALQLPEPCSNWWLFDAGEATQHQLMNTPLKLSKLDTIFVTHLHGDHIYGLPGLLSTRSFDGGVTPLRMIGPRGLRRYIETVFEISGTTLDYELEYVELGEADGQLAYEDERFSVVASTLIHRVPCFGYRVVEHDQPGRLLADKLKQLGVAPGPQYGLLKQGQDITMQDGTVIYANDVTAPSLPGRVVTILGDTTPCANVLELAMGADLLVHEATFAAGMEEKAHLFGHSTTVEAAKAAAEAGARKLVMTHFSGRYHNENLLQLEEEAQTLFGAATAATDLTCIEIERRT
ncbi:ribonuclease Z [Paenibacillus harenae]|uniref:Ribonuclease Z n=1 Tax=Paenibacillus harenae TaxID=306543 RepID=A0ABT9TVL7_PAEHA|nr:ribonuclease Z [Paenibacillus harenae]MDQ0111378.1 ribonuclease Z [Paenibacillus harenae]